MVGPLLRTMIDVGLHGILHKRTNCRIHVRVDALVADMDAMIQLCGKQVVTAAHCPWCNNALCPKGKEGHNGSWGRYFRDEKVGLQNGTGREPMADLIENIHMALVQNDQCFTGTTRK